MNDESLVKNVGVIFEKDAADTIRNSRSKFTARDRKKGGIVRRLQHVSGFPSDDAMRCAFNINKIKNVSFI